MMSKRMADNAALRPTLAFLQDALESVLKPEKCQYFCSGQAVSRQKPQEILSYFEDF